MDPASYLGRAMPALPDVRPLIINLLGRYLIQCKLGGLHVLRGQRSHEWGNLLEVLCSTLQSKNKVSHSTQQFIRYVNLLEHVRKLKEEKMTRQTLTEMKKILINFGMSPELREGPVSDKLTSLLIEAQSEHSVIGIEDFCEKVVDFVGMAMECYPVLPQISLTGDAFEAIVPSATTNTNPATEKHQDEGVQNDRQETPPVFHKKERQLFELAPGVLAKPAEDNSKSGAGLQATKPELKDLKIKLEFSPTPKPQPYAVMTLPNTEITGSPSLAPKIERFSLESPKGSNGIFTTVVTVPPSLKESSHKDASIDGGDVGTRKTRNQKRGIFDGATESDNEMAWSSDESAAINNTSNEVPGVATVDASSSANSANPTSSPPPLINIKFEIKKGAWSDKESECLMKGVEKLGEGKWKEIRAEYYSVLRYRTTNQLKDKYRNIRGRPKH